MVRSMNRLRTKHEVWQGRGVDRFDLGDRPVVAQSSRCHGVKFNKKNASSTSSAAIAATMVVVDQRPRAGGWYGLYFASVVEVPQR